MIKLTNVDKVVDFVRANPGCGPVLIAHSLDCDHAEAWEMIIDADRQGRTMSRRGPSGKWEFFEQPKVLAEYRISPKGLIVDPGKFQGERAEVVLAYEAFLEGWAEESDGVMFADVELWGVESRIHFYVDDNGFVREVVSDE